MLFQIKTCGFEQPFLQEMAGKYHTEYPCQRADNIIKHELCSIHLHNACNNGREGSDKGQKSCYNNCKSSIFLIKLMSLLQISALEEEIFFPIIHSRTYFTSCPVSYHIS